MSGLHRTLRQVEKLITWAHTGRQPSSEDVEIGMVHEGLLFAYGERDSEGLILRSSQTSERGMYRLVTGAMKELAEMGVPGVDLTSVSTAVTTWRDTYFVKAMEHYDTIQELQEAMPYCFACFSHSQRVELHRAHIVSKGSRIDLQAEPDNQLILCASCHIQTQHQHGWEVLIDRHPHLYPRIERARRLMNEDI